MKVAENSVAASQSQISLVIEPSSLISKSHFIKVTKFTGNAFDFSGRPTSMQCLISDYNK